MLLNDIDFDGGERKICRDCVDKLGGENKQETLKKVGDSTVYGTIELEEDEEEVEGTVIGGGVDEVSILSVVYRLVPYNIVHLSHNFPPFGTRGSLTFDIAIAPYTLSCISSLL